MCDPSCRHLLFEQGRQRAELSITQLWVSYLGVGGALDLFTIEAYLHGLTPLPAFQQDVLANALNERLDDLYRAARVPYLITDGLADPHFDEPVAVLRDLARSNREPPAGATGDGEAGLAVT